MKMLKRFQRFVKTPTGIVGLVLIILYCTMSLLAPLIAPYDPYQMHYQFRLHPPCRQFLLGTDQFGRDMLSRVLFGARLSLILSLVSTTIGAVLGTLLGVIAGYLGSYLDAVIMRFIDILLTFPPILTALIIASLRGGGLSNVVIGIAIAFTPIFARMIRGAVLIVKEEDFVQAAKALGASNLRIMLHHVLPNVASVIIVQFSLACSWAILLEATLSFLGFGVSPPTPSLGLMISEGRKTMEFAPWLIIYPGAVIMIAVLGINIMGDRLRDILDPRLRGV
jgi:peptide/nickel transport system permease protein